jgi:hypothetical protein
MRRIKSSNFEIGLSATVLGAFLLLLVVPVGVDTNDIGGDARVLLRPDFWPSIVSILILVTGGTVVMMRFFESNNNINTTKIVKRQINPFGVAASIIILVLLIMAEQLGLLITTVLIFLVATFAIDLERKYVKFIFGVCFPCLMIFFFDYIAGIPMPLGSIISGILGR